MSAIGVLARKDLLEFARDRRVFILALITLALALTAVVTAYTQVTRYETDRRVSEQRDRATWEGQGERNPHGAAHFAAWALRPLTPLALLDPGTTPHAGSAIWMEAHSQNTAQARAVEDAANSFSSGGFSVASVLQTLVPLVILILAAGAVAGERARGTLRMLLVSGTPASAIVPAKLLSLGLAVALLVLPVLVAALAATLAAGPLPITHFLLWMLAYGLFFTIVAAVAIAVSALSRSLSHALVLLLGLWLLAVVLMPRVGAGAVGWLAPTPSAEAFWTDVEAGKAAQPKVFGADAAAFGEAMAKRYEVETVDDLPVSFRGLQLNEDERLIAEVFDQHFGALAAHYQDQRKLLRLTAVFTPLPALQNISMALAGTDLAHHLAFQDQAEAHRRKIVGALNRDLIEHGKEEGFDYVADETLWRSIPQFEYVAPALEPSLRAVAPDIAILLLWSLLAAALLYSASRKLSRGGP